MLAPEKTAVSVDLAQIYGLEGDVPTDGGCCARIKTALYVIQIPAIVLLNLIMISLAVWFQTTLRSVVIMLHLLLIIMQVVLLRQRKAAREPPGLRIG